MKQRAVFPWVQSHLLPMVRPFAGLWLENQKYFGGTLNGEMAQKDDFTHIRKDRELAGTLFSGQNPAIGELPLAPRRQTVPSGGLEASLRYSLWRDNHLRRDCQKMAVKLNKPGMSAQAVGGAVGHNPISLIIPCHRVVGSNGT